MSWHWFKLPRTLPTLEPTATQPLAADLVARTLEGLPLPAELIKASKDAFESPVSLLDLKLAYENLRVQPGWTHFLGRLLEIKSIYERAILIGERDRFGNDLTPALRASYGTLLQILALPGQVESLQQESESVLIGAQDIDNGPWEP